MFTSTHAFGDDVHHTVHALSWIVFKEPTQVAWVVTPRSGCRFGLLLPFESSRTSAGDGCLFLLEP